MSLWEKVKQLICQKSKLFLLVLLLSCYYVLYAYYIVVHHGKLHGRVLSGSSVCMYVVYVYFGRKTPDELLLRDWKTLSFLFPSSIWKSRHVNYLACMNACIQVQINKYELATTTPTNNTLLSLILRGWIVVVYATSFSFYSIPPRERNVFQRVSETSSSSRYLVTSERANKVVRISIDRLSNPDFQQHRVYASNIHICRIYGGVARFAYVHMFTGRPSATVSIDGRGLL